MWLQQSDQLYDFRRSDFQRYDYFPYISHTFSENAKSCFDIFLQGENHFDKNSMESESELRDQNSRMDLVPSFAMEKG